MGKSSKKSDTIVEAAPAVIKATKPLKKGKREPEDDLETKVNLKKQKKDVTAAVQKEKAEKKAPKKVESSDSSDSSDSEEEVKAKKVPAKKVPAKVASSSDESSDDSSSDDEPAKNKAATNGAVTKKAKDDSSSEEESSDEDVAAAKKPAAAAKNVAVKAKAESSSSEEDSSEDEEPAKKPAVKVAAKPAAKDSSSSEDDSDEDSEEEKKPAAKKAAPAKAASSSDSSDEDSDEESEDEKPAAKKAKAETKAAKKESSIDESSDESDEESEEEKQTPKKSSDVEMVDAEQISNAKQQQTPSTPSAGGSKTLFAANLSFQIERSNVEDFFREAGEVVDVRFATDKEDGRFRGFGHVEFATSEQAQKALEFAGRPLLGREIRLDVATERGERGERAPYTPQSGNFRSGGGGGQTVFVKGFDSSLPEEEIKSALSEHFSSCGEVTRVSVPMDRDTGSSKGIAYIDLKDGVDKAMELNGSDMNGWNIVVDEPRPRESGGGRGGGGRFSGGGGGRFSNGGGRSSGRGRDSGRGRFGGGRSNGRGRDGGGRGRPSFTPSGKKTTFSDE